MTVLVLDIGTSSARALLFDDQARPIPDALIQHKYDVTTTPPGAATLDAEELRDIVETCIDEILQHPAAKDIRVVGMATFVGNLLGVDKDGKPVTPIYLYSDTRCAEVIPQMQKTLGQFVGLEKIHQSTGCPIHTAYHPARLEWLERTQYADFWTKWLDFSTYLYTYWFGKTWWIENPASCSFSVASWSGLLDRISLNWSEIWIAYFYEAVTHAANAHYHRQLRSEGKRTLIGETLFPDDAFTKFLPLLADYDTVENGLTTTYAERWHVLKDTPFCLAIGDGAAANIGTGCCDTTRIALSLGTTAALRTTIPASSNSLSATTGEIRNTHTFLSGDFPERLPLFSSIDWEKMEIANAFPFVPSGLWCYRITRDLHLMGGATSEGGNLHRWSRETLQLPPDFTDQLALRPVDGHGLTALPLLAGERSPGWSLDATGSIAGLRLSTTPLDIAQALFEGLALRLAIIYEQLGDYVDMESEIIASGGALSPYLAQIIADALNHPLKVTAETEITSRGVALLALKAVGVEVSLSEAPEIAYEVQPRPEAVTALQSARVRQADLYRKMIGDQGSST